MTHLPFRPYSTAARPRSGVRSQPTSSRVASSRAPPVPTAVFYQGQVANRAYQSVHQLGNPEGYLFARRPFQVTWFANQVAIALGLWEYDHGLMRALDLAKQFLVPLDVLNAIWPCPGESRRDLARTARVCSHEAPVRLVAQASHRDELRRRLHDACVAAGQPPPPPIQAHLPAMLQTHSAQ